MGYIEERPIHIAQLFFIPLLFIGIPEVNIYKVMTQRKSLNQFSIMPAHCRKLWRFLSVARTLTQFETLIKTGIIKKLNLFYCNPEPGKTPILPDWMRSGVVDEDILILTQLKNQKPI